MKTSELTGAALDWAVQQCEGARKDIDFVWWVDDHYTPSTDWAQGGPIIEREMREFGFDLWAGIHVPPGQFAATYCRGVPDTYIYGPTPLIAALRCYVASKLGNNVEIPKELISNESTAFRV